MARGREIRQTHWTYVLSRAVDRASHAAPARRGGYLIILPGRPPEIVLDGLASAAEQKAAELRCMRELEKSLYEAQISGHDQEHEQRRRQLVRLDREVVVTRENDPATHADPRRRGAYLLQKPGQMPEIVLDALATDEEQRAGEQRCLRELHGPPPASHQSDTVGRLKEALAQRRGPSSRSSQQAPLRLGDLLVRRGLLQPEDVQRALDEQARLPANAPVRRLGSLLAAAGRLPLAQVARELGHLRGVEPTSGTVTRVEPSLRLLFPLDGLLEIQAAPLFVAGRSLAVAMCDPQRQDQIDLLQSLTDYHVRPLQAPQHQVHQLLASIRRS